MSLFCLLSYMESNNCINPMSSKKHLLTTVISIWSSERVDETISVQLKSYGIAEGGGTEQSSKSRGAIMRVK